MDDEHSDPDGSDAVKLSEEDTQQGKEYQQEVVVGHKVTVEGAKSERSPTCDGNQDNTWKGSDPSGDDNQNPQWAAEEEASRDEEVKTVTVATDNDDSEKLANKAGGHYWHQPAEYPGDMVLILKTQSKPKGCPVETIMQSYGMYKVIWNGCDDELWHILTWFKNELKPGDENSVIEFPPTFTNDDRRSVHVMYRSMKLGGHSYFNGVKNQKVLKVYTSEKACQKKLGKLRKKTTKNTAMNLVEWLQGRYNGRIPGGYFLKDIIEMVAFKQMADENLQQLYEEYQQGNRGRTDRSETKTRQPTDFLETETKQSFKKAATRVWIDPEDGKMGHFFFNKLQFQDGSYWDYQDIGSTQLLTFSDLVPVYGLNSIFIIQDTWFSDPSVVTGYFPPSVIVTVVCPKHYHQKGVCNYQLVDCSYHRKDVTGYDMETGELVDVKCECSDKSIIEIIQPDFSHKLSAKLMIMRYQTFARIVVSSVLLDQTSWRTIGQYGWYCDLPLDMQQRTLEPVPSGSFGDTLARFLEEITVKPVSVLRGISFSELSPTVKLVMSAPARNCKRDVYRHGMYNIGHLISGLPWPSAEPSLIYQTPVIDFENRVFSFIALLENLSSSNLVNLNSSDRKDWESRLNQTEMKIVYPSNMKETSEFLFQKGFEKMESCDSKFYTRPYMFDNEDPVFGKIAWNSRVINRFCEVSDCNPKTKVARKFGWLLVGSFDLSCDSWGEVSNTSADVNFFSYQLGVLHMPQQINTQEGPQLWAPDFSTIVLPYNETSLVKYPQYAYPVMQRVDSQQPKIVGRLCFRGSTSMFIQETFPHSKQEEEFIGDLQQNRSNWNAARPRLQRDMSRDARLQRDMFRDALLRQGTLLKCPGFAPVNGSLLAFHVARPSTSQGLIVQWVSDFMYPERHEKTEVENKESKDVLCMNFAQLPLSDPVGAAAPAETLEQTNNQPTMVKYTGMKVIGLEADPYSLTIPSPGAFKVKRPEPRDVFLKKMLNNIHGVDFTKPNAQTQRRLRQARALLVSTKKKMLVVKTDGDSDRKN